MEKEVLVNKIKNRFLVKYGNFLEFKQKEEISHFYADDKTVFLVDTKNKRFTIDYSLEKLEKLLSPNDFFRINRRFIIHIAAIKRIRIYSSRKLEIQMGFSVQEPILVARNRVENFRNWLDC